MNKTQVPLCCNVSLSIWEKPPTLYNQQKFSTWSLNPSTKHKSWFMETVNKKTGTMHLLECQLDCGRLPNVCAIWDVVPSSCLQCPGSRWNILETMCACNFGDSACNPSGVVSTTGHNASNLFEPNFNTQSTKTTWCIWLCSTHFVYWHY